MAIFGRAFPIRPWISRSPPSATGISVSVTESASATDTLDATAVFASTASESATAADAASASAIFGNTVSESGSATDSDSSAAVFASAITETGAANDSGDATGAFGCAVSESATASDSGSSSAVFPSSVSESATASDAEDATVSTGATYNDSVSESTSAADVVAADLIRSARNDGHWDFQRKAPRARGSIAAQELSPDRAAIDIAVGVAPARLRLAATENRRDTAAIHGSISSRLILNASETLADIARSKGHARFDDDEEILRSIAFLLTDQNTNGHDLTVSRDEAGRFVGIEQAIKTPSLVQ